MDRQLRFRGDLVPWLGMSYLTPGHVTVISMVVDSLFPRLCAPLSGTVVGFRGVQAPRCADGPQPGPGAPASPRSLQGEGPCGARPLELLRTSPAPGTTTVRFAASGPGAACVAQDERSLGGARRPMLCPPHAQS